MKIYTEIVYTWDDNKGELVEESSKSFDYQGEVTLCDTKRYWHNHALADALGIGSGSGGSAASAAANMVNNWVVPEFIIPDIPTAADIQDAVQDVTGDDPVGDIKDQADAAETSINETVATTIDTGQSNLEGILEDNNDTLADAGDKIDANIAGINDDIETGIDENTDTLNQMEDTFNSNVADVNVALDNAQSMINDTTNIINQGLDASININNPDSLITNPQGWYDNNIEGLRQGHGKDWYDLAQGHHDEFIEQGAENIGNLFNDYGEILGGVFGGMFNDTVDSLGQAFAQPGVKSRRDTSNAGDPFGNPSETRRLISEKRTFNTAQSLINA